MKTTLNLPDALFAQLKETAAREDRTATSIVIQALRHQLADTSQTAEALELPTWASGGYRVDITDRDALFDALDGRS